MSDRTGAALVLALATVVTASLLRRAATRPAAWACTAFCLLEGARLAIDLARSPESPWWLAWADVVIVVAMPGCWAGLLRTRGGPAWPSVLRDVSVRHTDLPPTEPRESWVGRPIKERCANRRRRNRQDAPERAKQHARILPALVLLGYAAVLLATRHQLAVSAHWHEALQAPRLVVGAWALWVALARRKNEGPEGGGTSEPFGRLLSVQRRPYASPLPPSTAIGLVLALGAAASVIGGLWPTWGAVRALSLLSWALVAAVAWRARE